jgi:branched-chain amino acid transport system ATP-binding protein
VSGLLGHRRRRQHGPEGEAGATNGRPSALLARGIQARYGKSQVIGGLDISVGVGEIVVVLGRNGSGKTSTMLALAGDTPRSALTARADVLTLLNEDVRGLPAFERARKGLAFVPSGARVFGGLSVHENLDVVRAGRGVQRWTVPAIYEMFPDLHALRHSRGGQLSGGERQMLAVGRALLTEPAVLMLDEPSEGLAPMIVAQLHRTVRALADEKLSILLTEQNHALALSLADRAYFIEKGAVVWTGASSAVDHGVLSAYLGV